VATESGDRIVILIPLYNDWEALSLLLPALDDCLEEIGTPAAVLIVDDGSTDAIPVGRLEQGHRHIQSIDVLRLRRNLGHQRAIAIGLVHVYQEMPCRAVVVMDADGEDRPKDVPRLLAAFDESGRREIVFAARTRRLESRTFRAFYQLYRVLHRILVGIEVRVGNFSVIPWISLERLVAVSDLWNHYAAAVFRARLPYRMLPLPRGARLFGGSRLNFASLVIHGLSAILVFGDKVGVRLLTGSLILMAALLVFGGALWIMELSGWVALPGWSAVVAGLLVLALGLVIAATLYTFHVIGARTGTTFLPLRDASFFVLERVSISG
jgi:glycosyltransferase involved in cell wall biosynthesis